MKKIKSNKDFYKQLWLWILIFISSFIFPALALIELILVVAIIIYSGIYFRNPKFQDIKTSITEFICDCNELNQHINELRNSYINYKKIDYGEAQFQNISRYKYKKNGINNAKYAPNIYDCTKTVCDNARKQPFKYVCKYFNIKSDEETLSKFEEILNNFTAAEEGKNLLLNKKNEILNNISKNVPIIIRKLFPEKFERELGFEEFNFNELFYPTFTFRYISSGGNSGSQFNIVFDIPMIERFVNYLSESVKFQKSTAGQRRLMTPKLRSSIIERDNHTCMLCKNSTYNEPNLLLEVDHIIPIAKGGLTSEENLQTLCWKCNRHKGSKII